MIHLKITAELTTDLMTPSVCVPHKLIEGLPEGCQLINVSFNPNTGIILYVFDDGEAETVDIVLKYRQIFEINEEVHTALMDHKIITK